MKLSKTNRIWTVLALACTGFRSEVSGAQTTREAVGTAIPSVVEVRSPIMLEAVTDQITGKSAFSFNGEEVPPIIRTSPGETVIIDYANHMSPDSREQCVDGTCRNMTNLHFHGLHVSPAAPQDDVITMMAMPGESLHYVVDIPKDQPPGLYWYHTHPHGESYQQSLDGMSGAIIIDGIDRYVPEIRQMTERVLVLRDFDLTADPSARAKMSNAVTLSTAPCGDVTEKPERIFTVNGVIRPKIPIAPGEQQFWRIVNASPDLYADLEVDGSMMTVVAMDGMPLGFHDPLHPRREMKHVLLPPAGRLEAVVRGPKGQNATLLTRCVDTGRDGDPNPRMVVADLDDRTDEPRKPEPVSTTSSFPSHPTEFALSKTLLEKTETSAPQFAVEFTEDDHGFYINGKKYGPDAPPMAVVRTGHLVHWKVTNETDEIHPFHIHQVHFLLYAINGKRVEHPIWLDTANVPTRGQLDLVMDFRDPIIRGLSLFHCHLLKHEDKGMMAKILFQ